MSVNSNVLVVCGTALLLAVVGAVVGLALNGTIPGTDAVGILGIIVTLGGGAIAVHTGVNAGANAANNTTPPPNP